MYAYVCVCMCMYVYVCVCMCMYVYVCVCMRMYVYVCVCMYMYVHVGMSRVQGQLRRNTSIQVNHQKNECSNGKGTVVAGTQSLDRT